MGGLIIVCVILAVICIVLLIQKALLNHRIRKLAEQVDGFNSGVRDFSEFNYNLRGTVERMDVSVRDLVQGLREVSRSLERRERE